LRLEKESSLYVPPKLSYCQEDLEHELKKIQNIRIRDTSNAKLSYDAASHGMDPMKYDQLIGIEMSFENDQSK